MSKFPKIRIRRWMVIITFTRAAYMMGLIWPPKAKRTYRPRDARFVQIERTEYGGAFRIGRLGTSRVGQRMTRFGRMVGTLHTFNNILGRGIANVHWFVAIERTTFSWVPTVFVEDDGDGGGIQLTWLGGAFRWSHSWGIYGPTPSRRQLWMWNHVWSYVQAPFHAWQERQFNREMDAMRESAEARRAKLEAEVAAIPMASHHEDDAHRRSRA